MSFVSNSFHRLRTVYRTRIGCWYACPVCTLVQRDRALCEYCSDELYRRREVTVRDFGAYRTRSLYAWRRDAWAGLHWWAAALKRKEHRAFWREFATWMVESFGRPAAGTTVVPIPSAAPGNHARGLAEAFAELAGLEVSDVLTVRPARRRKRFGRDARRGPKFDRRDGHRPLDRVIIVDDVVRSGATAEAAYRALGQPAWCEVWCVMDRRPAGR